NVIYHYTSIQTLYRILTGKEFWLGNTSSMNDKSEFSHFAGVLKSELIKDVPEKQLEIKEYFKNVNARIQKEYPYAMCFSVLNDDAAQWERYANNATGVCIGIDLSVMLDVFYYFPYCILNKVFYENHLKEHDHYFVLKNYFLTDNMLEFSDKQGQIDNLLFCSALYKHKSFSAEQEFRLAILRNSNAPGSSIGFSENDNQIKKVLKLDMNTLCANSGYKFEDLFKSILVGPRSMQSVADLKSYCAELQYKKLANNIRPSDCPLR
ncbi:MAG: DUF2971 domain-containing protein, partial [Clostridia bacterium]|nr:DUF2971 domain-containing protein [Clostridia bacterium]